MTGKMILGLLALAPFLSDAAEVSVADVTLVQSAEGREVEIAYTLQGASAIVTVGIESQKANGEYVAIASRYLQAMAGDVNRLVSPGARKVKWPVTADCAAGTTNRFRAVVRLWSVDDPPDYAAIDLVGSSNVAYFATAEEVSGGVSDERYKTSMILMRRIPAAAAGAWTMGSPSDEAYRVAEYEAQHQVTLSTDYYMAVYPCTQRQYWYIAHGSVGGSYSSLKNAERPDLHPVAGVTYNDVRGSDWPAGKHATVAANSVLDRLRKLTGVQFDLPTEAQWEFACRAGSVSQVYGGRSFSSGGESLTVVPCVDEVGWYRANTGCDTGWGDPDFTMPVGRKIPNDWGLYDMLGNVQEWCLDWFAESLSDATNPEGATSGTERVMRGGGHYSYAKNLRCANRQSKIPGSGGNMYAVGFRVVAPIGGDLQ